MASNNRRLALASLFGALTFVTLGFLPAPASDYLIAIEAFFFALSFLVIGRGGATYVGIVSGLLISAVKPPIFFPLDLVFALMLGVLVDGLGLALGAKRGSEARTKVLVLVMIVSTGLVGFVAYYVSAVMTNLVPNDIILDAITIVFGIGSGAAGGFAAARVWNGYLRQRV